MNQDAALKNIEKKLNALRSLANEALMELAEIKTTQQAPESPRKRRNLREIRIDDYAADVAAGTWRKPAELRKTALKKQ